MNLSTFATQSNILEGNDHEPSHIVHTEVLTDFVQLPKITVKALNDAACRLHSDIKLRGEAETIIFYGKTVEFKLENLKNLLRFINDKDIPSWTAYMKFQSLQPFSVTQVNAMLGRAIWLWMEIKSGVTWDENFLWRFHNQAILWYMNREING